MNARRTRVHHDPRATRSCLVVGSADASLADFVGSRRGKDWVGQAVEVEHVQEEADVVVWARAVLVPSDQDVAPAGGGATSLLL